MLNQLVKNSGAQLGQSEAKRAIRTVLLATDGSSSAKTALKSAIAAAKGQEGHLIITYFADPNDVTLYDGFPCRDAGEWQSCGKQILERMAEQARAAGVAQVETILEAYQGEELLSELAKRVNAQLIILGSHLF
jgi:nucleotide-binding universal stress UspA family protein